MPYKSDKQRRFLHARHPEIAARWDAEIRASRKRKVHKGLLSAVKGFTPRDKKIMAIGGGTAVASAAAVPWARKHSLFNRQNRNVDKSLAAISLAELGEINKGLSIKNARRLAVAMRKGKVMQEDYKAGKPMSAEQRKRMWHGNYAEARLMRHETGRDAARIIAERLPDKPYLPQEMQALATYRARLMNMSRPGKKLEEDLIEAANADTGRPPLPPGRSVARLAGNPDLAENRARMAARARLRSQEKYILSEPKRPPDALQRKRRARRPE